MMTPGPWLVESGAVYTWHQFGNGWDKTPIAVMDRSPGNGTLPVERDANAYFIAAVPDLLTVAQACLGYFDYMAAQGSDLTPDTQWLEPLKAAIVKATRS